MSFSQATCKASTLTSIPSRLFVISIFLLLIITLNSDFPEIFIFANNTASTSTILPPLHLSDDVMITVKAGRMLALLGFPGLNNGNDIAFPSTSLAGPYLTYILHFLLPESLDVYAYSFLGLISVVITISIILLSSKNILFIVVYGLALALNSTTKAYALNGWDHNFSALFLILALLIFLHQQSPSAKSKYLMGFYLGLAVLFRPDTIFFPVLAFLCLIKECKSEFLSKYVGSLILFSAVIMLPLLNIYISSGHRYILPTTFRLKNGASPSLIYSVKYFLSNTFLHFTSLSILVFTLSMLFLFFRPLQSRQTCILAAVLSSMGFAFVNSDVFPHGRMFWVASMATSYILSINSPDLLRGFHLKTLRGLLSNGFDGTLIRSKSIIFALVSMIIAGNIMSNFKDSLQSKSIILDPRSSTTATHYQLLTWIDQHLNPVDGAIGIFWLGTSVYSDRFIYADFLGKGDEMIASSRPKWGPPGHNKWNIEKSLQKWNPQVIIPNEPFRNINPLDSQAVNQLKSRAVNKTDYAFVADLVFSRPVNNKYSLCKVILPSRGLDEWSIFVRKDIVVRQKMFLSCQ